MGNLAIYNINNGDDLVAIGDLYNYPSSDYLSCIINYCPHLVSDYTLGLLSNMLDYEAIEAIHCGVSNISNDEYLYISETIAFNLICQYIIYNYN